MLKNIGQEGRNQTQSASEKTIENFNDLSQELSV